MKINLLCLSFIATLLLLNTSISMAQADTSVSPHHTKAKHPKKYILNEKLCKEAFDVLPSCFDDYIKKCDKKELITAYLPGAPRRTLGFIANHKGFNDDGFDKLCYKTCITQGDFEIEYETFKKLVCQSY